MKTQNRRIGTVAGALAVAVAGICSADPPQYEVLVLEIPDDELVVYPWGINDKAQIVGSYGYVDKPFLWDRGEFIPLEDPFDYYKATCYEINAAGQIAGTMSMSAPPAHGFMYDSGEYTDLGVVDDGNYAEATAINSFAQITGYSGHTTYGDWRAFLWEDGVLHDLAADFPTTDSRGMDINDHGQITGYMWNGSDQTAFIWDQGEVQDLGPVPGGISSRGKAINNNGEVAIQGGMSHSIGHGFLYRDGEMTDIGLVPGATRCHVLDMNDSAEIVGYDDNYPDGPGDWAFVWRDGSIYALQDCVPAGLDLELVFSYAINNAGQITASGYLAGEWVHVLLTPINPRPADVNRDGRVNIDDLFEILGYWGPCPDPPQMCPADVNGDTIVGIDDIFEVLADWGW